MPELPEAENLCRALTANVVGKRIVDVSFRQPKGLNLPGAEFLQRVKGRVQKVQRRGKAVVISLDDGTLWLHMGLRSEVGYMTWCDAPPSAFLVLIFDDDSCFYMDKTFMGYAHFFSEGEFDRRWREAGVEPLGDEFTPQMLKRLAEARPNVAIKALLMDQAVIAGIGNVYSDEILHAVGMDPSRKASSLSEQEIGAVYRAIQGVLKEAIERGAGPEWIGFDGKPGGYVPRVHGVKRCPEHDCPVRKISFGGRTAYVCENGQG
ncbi:MAG: Fpg/Nei family DNA glycosylase [Chloroflexi bacterium]|nr:Fpg/Nei family DNA glycosylase [Chloroflexota bacterium]